MPDDAQLTIGEVAKRAGLRPSSIRYYESIGVLAEPERLAGRRRYSPEVLRELAVIDIAQRAGMSLAEIRDLVGAVRGEGAFAERLRGLAERKLPELDALIARAERVSRWLEVASQCGCATVDDCGLFHEEQALPPRGSLCRPAGLADDDEHAARRDRPQQG